MRKQGLTIILLLLMIRLDAVEYQIPSLMPFPSGDSIYHIGWSKNGNFAYLKYYNIGETCGDCPVWSLEIQSAVTDETLFSKIYSEEDASLKELWEKQAVEISGKLKEYSIRQGGTDLTTSLTFTYKQRQFTISATSETAPFPFQAFEAPEIITSFVTRAAVMITAESSSSGGAGGSPAEVTKTVFSYERGEHSPDTIIDILPAGFLTSQLEPRIMILYSLHYLDGEGAIRHKVGFTGAHLTAGFE